MFVLARLRAAVKINDNKTVDVELPSNTTVLEAKKKAAQVGRMRFPLERRLNLNGRRLDDDAVLQDVGLSPETVLVLGGSHLLL